jgi:hypothetical protein
MQLTVLKSRTAQQKFTLCSRKNFAHFGIQFCQCTYSIPSRYCAFNDSLALGTITNPL